MPNTDLATIVVKLDGGEKKSPIASGGGGDKEVSTGFQGAASLVNASKKLFAVGTPLYFAKTIAKNRIGTVNLQTGALEYEQKLQFATQTVETVLSTAGSAILAGAAAGPIGVVATLGTFFLTKALDIAEWYRQRSINTNLEEIGQLMQRRRMGNLPSTDGRRTWR